MERVGKYVCDKGSGNLFEVIQHVVFAAGADVNEEGVHGFVDVGDDILFLTRATPATLEELRAGEAEQERQRREHEEKAAKAHAKLLNAQPRQPLTLAELEGKELITLAAAFQTLIDHRAEITTNNGTLSIALPQRLHEDPNQDAEPDGTCTKPPAYSTTAVTSSSPTCRQTRSYRADR